jgi:hypothetical protein
MVKSTARFRSLKFVVPALALGGAVALFSPGAVAQKKGAAGKKAPACGLRNFPLYAGASWTYKSGTDEMKIAVDEVGPGKDADGAPATIIKVSETYKGETSILQYSCTDKKGLRVPVESFFFTGEAGGLWGTQLAITKHDDVWLHPDVDVSGDNGWQESVKADATRTDLGGRGAKHPDAKVEIERYVKVDGVEQLQVPAGTWNAIKVTLQLRAKALIGEEKADVLVDDKTPGNMWFVKDLGIIGYEDNLKTRKAWQLVATTVPLPK